MRHNFKQKNKQAGFTLIETFGAITILVLAVLGPLGLLAANIADSTVIKNQMIANYLAQEGIELVVRERNLQVVNDEPAQAWLGDFTLCTENNPCNVDAKNFDFLPCDPDDDNGCRMYASAEDTPIPNEPDKTVREWIQFFSEDSGLDTEPTDFKRQVYWEVDENGGDDFYDSVDVPVDPEVPDAGSAKYFEGNERVRVVVRIDWSFKGLPKTYALATYIYNLQSAKPQVVVVP